MDKLAKILVTLIFTTMVAALLVTVFVSQALSKTSSEIHFLARANPLKLDITKWKKINKKHYQLTAILENQGKVTVKHLRIKLILPDALKTHHKTKFIPKLAGGKSRKFNWKVRVKNSGDYLIKIKAKGVLVDINQIVEVFSQKEVRAKITKEKEDDKENYLYGKHYDLSLSTTSFLVKTTLFSKFISW